MQHCVPDPQGSQGFTAAPSARDSRDRQARMAEELREHINLAMRDAGAPDETGGTAGPAE
jgi:hypothetical protein